MNEEKNPNEWNEAEKKPAELPKIKPAQPVADEEEQVPIPPKPTFGAMKKKEKPKKEKKPKEKKSPEEKGSTSAADKLSEIKNKLSNWKVSAGCVALAVVCLIGGLSSCGGSSQKDIKIRELETQLQEKDDEIAVLEDELDDLKNGPDRKLETVQAKSTDKDWEGVIAAADELHANYPGSAQDQKGQELKKAAQSEIDKAAEAKRQEEERKKKEEEQKKAEEAAKKAEEERIRAEKEAQGYETGITYDQLARYPDQYIGEKVKFNGKVIQIMNDGDMYQIRLAVNSNYDTVLLATFDKSAMTNGKVLEDDVITVYGMSLGDYTYQAVMGNEITVPLISVNKIDQ